MKRKWLWLAAPLVVALALIPLSQKQREFIHLFERVPGTDGCGVFDGSLWMSPGEVVCLVPPPPAPNSAAMIGFLSVDKIDAVNAQTGAHRALAMPPTHHDISGSFGVMVSPDGKWILWAGMAYDAKADLYRGDQWNAMTLDGKRFVQRTRVGYANTSLGFAWLPDSSGWVEACPANNKTGDVRLRVCSLDNKSVREINVPQAKGANGIFAVNAASEAVIGCYQARDWTLTLATVPLAGNGPTRVHRVTPPAQFNGATAPRALISPRGDRICWTFRDANAMTDTLWLSDINGQKFEMLMPNSNRLGAPPKKLHWTPDGKSLSCWRPTPGSKRADFTLYRINIPSSLSLKP